MITSSFKKKRRPRRWVPKTPDPVASAILRYCLTEALRLKGQTLRELSRRTGIPRIRLSNFLSGFSARMQYRTVRPIMHNAGLGNLLSDAVVSSLWTGRPLGMNRPPDLVMEDDKQEYTASDKRPWYFNNVKLSRSEGVALNWAIRRSRIDERKQRRAKDKRASQKRRKTESIPRHEAVRGG